MSARAGVGTGVDADAGAAAEAAAAEAAAALGSGAADLAAVFLAPQHAAHAEAAVEAVRRRLAPATLVGASGEAVIGKGRELESEPAVSVLAATAPGLTAEAHHLVVREEDGEAVLVGLPDGFAPDPLGPPTVLLADPYSFPADAFLAHLNGRAGPPLVVGGMTSGGGGPGEHVLLRDGDVFREGALLVAVRGPVELHALVSQGCAPIGPDLTVTAAEANVVRELAGRPAYEQLMAIVTDLDPGRRELLRNGVLAGVVVDENVADRGRGDYVMRGVLGVDPDTGALAIGDVPRVGQTLRFHVRDADTADADLRGALRLQRAVGGRPLAGILFACNGRGTRMFEAPDHDAATVADELGGVPVAGMFCAGEIGPVGGVNFLHGFTATMALLVARAG